MLRRSHRRSREPPLSAPDGAGVAARVSRDRMAYRRRRSSLQMHHQDVGVLRHDVVLTCGNGLKLPDDDVGRGAASQCPCKGVTMHVHAAADAPIHRTLVVEALSPPSRGARESPSRGERQRAFRHVMVLIKEKIEKTNRKHFTMLELS